MLLYIISSMVNAPAINTPMLTNIQVNAVNKQNLLFSSGSQAESLLK
jgi:hypothetical protein